MSDFDENHAQMETLVGFRALIAEVMVLGHISSVITVFNGRSSNDGR
jgi:hypothetical protein